MRTNLNCIKINVISFSLVINYVLVYIQKRKEQSDIASLSQQSNIPDDYDIVQKSSNGQDKYYFINENVKQQEISLLKAESTQLSLEKEQVQAQKEQSSIVRPYIIEVSSNSLSSKSGTDGWEEVNQIKQVGGGDNVFLEDQIQSYSSDNQDNQEENNYQHPKNTIKLEKHITKGKLFQENNQSSSSDESGSSPEKIENSQQSKSSEFETMMNLNFSSSNQESSKSSSQHSQSSDQSSQEGHPDNSSDGQSEQSQTPTSHTYQINQQEKCQVQFELHSKESPGQQQQNQQTQEGKEQKAIQENSRFSQQFPSAKQDYPEEQLINLKKSCQNERNSTVGTQNIKETLTQQEHSNCFLSQETNESHTASFQSGEDTRDESKIKCNDTTIISQYDLLNANMSIGSILSNLDEGEEESPMKKQFFESQSHSINNTEQTLTIEHSLDQRQQKLRILLKCVTLINCIFYGFACSNQQLLNQENLRIVVTIYLCLETCFRLWCLGRDWQLVYQLIILFLSLLFIQQDISYAFQPIYFSRFIVSIFDISSVLPFLQTFNATLRTAAPRILKIIIPPFILCFILQLQPLSNYLKSFFSISKALSVLLHSSLQLKDHLKIEYQEDLLSILSSLIFLFLVKIVSENLINAVITTKQLKTAEDNSQAFSWNLSKVAVLSKSSFCTYLMKKQLLYSLIQCCFIMIYCFGYKITGNNQSLDIFISNYCNFIWLLIPIYEFLVDNATTIDQFSITKRIIYIAVFFSPESRSLLLWIPLFSVCSRIECLQRILRILKDNILCTISIISLNWILFSITSSSSHSILPMAMQQAFQFVIVLPFLKSRFLLNAINPQSINNPKVVDTETIITDNGFQMPISMIDSQRNKSLSSLLQRSFFIFKHSSNIRKVITRIIKSTPFRIFSAVFFYGVAFKELAMTIYFQNITHPACQIEYWSELIEPPVTLIIISLECVSKGFLLGRDSFLQSSLRNSALFSIAIVTYAIQSSFSDIYLGFLRVLFIFCIHPPSSILARFFSAISLTLKEILCSLILAVLCFLTLPPLASSLGFFTYQLIYIISVNLITYLIQVSHNFLTDQQYDLDRWIRAKIEAHQRKLSQGFSFNNKTNWNNIFVLFCYCTYLLLLFSAAYIPELSQSNPFLQFYIVTSFSFAIIFYCTSSIVISGWFLFINTPKNKTLLFQSILLLLILIAHFTFNWQHDFSTFIQFLVQIPLIFRTNLISRLTKHKSTIICQFVRTLMLASILIVLLTQITTSVKQSMQLCLLIFFDIQYLPFNSSQEEQWKVLLFFIVLIIVNAMNSQIALEIISFKQESLRLLPQKTSYNNMLERIEQLWIKHNSSSPSYYFIATSKLNELIVEFEKQDEQQEDHQQEIQPVLKKNSRDLISYKEALIHILMPKMSKENIDSQFNQILTK